MHTDFPASCLRKKKKKKRVQFKKSLNNALTRYFKDIEN